MPILHVYKSKTNLKNSATGMKKDNLLLTRYSHFLLVLKEVKIVARIFSTYFDNNKLKSETRELSKNVTTGCIFFKVSSVDQVGNNYIRISPKQLPVQKLPF